MLTFPRFTTAALASALALATAALAPTSRAQTIISGPIAFPITANATYASGLLLNNSAFVSVAYAVAVNASGGTYIDSGLLQLAENVTWNSGSAFTVGAAGTVLAASGTQISATTVNLYGPAYFSGTLTTQQVNRQDVGGTLTLDGGTLTATAHQSAFLNGFTGSSLVLAAGGGTINTGSFNLTVPGTFTGSGRLTKTGTGTLTLTGSNLHTGGATVSGGILRLGVAGALPATSAITIAGGAALDLQSFATSLDTIGGFGSIQFQNILSVGGNHGTSTFAGVLSGTGTLTKAGTGTLTLANHNIHTGGTNVQGGTLVLGSNAALLTTENVAISGGATLDLSGYDTTLRSVSGAGNVTLGGRSLSLGGTDTTATLSGAITGGGLITKTGSGTLTLTEGNYGNIGFNLNAGTLAFTTPATLSAVSVNAGTLSFSGNTSIGSLGLSAGTVALGGASHTVGNLDYTAGALANGALRVTTSAILRGNLTLGTGGLDLTFEPAAAFTLQRFLDPATTTVVDGTRTTASVQLGPVASTYGTLVLQSGTWTNSGATSVGHAGTGALTLNGGTFTTGTLSLAQAGGTGTVNLNAGTLVTGGITRNSNTAAAGGLINFNGGTLRASADNSAFLANFTTAHANLGASGLTLDTQGYVIGLPSSISGPGNLIKTGSGTLTLLAPQSYTGGTLISAGTLVFGSGASLGSGIVNNAIFAFDRTDNLSFSSIGGTGAVVKNGAGTLTFNGANTYTGGTNVNAGTLALAADNALAHPAADLAVNATGTVQLTSGTASAAKVTLGLGGAGGTLLLSGGRLDTATIERWSGPSTATFDGGTLRATAATAALLNGFTSGSAVLGTGGLTVDTQAFAVTLPAEFTGTGGLTKTGTGTLTLSGNSAHTGPTLVSAGTLALAADAALGAPGGGVTLNATTLQATGTFSTARPVTVTGNAAIEVAAAAALTATGIVSGTGTLAKNGTGTLVLSGTNTYGGATTINAGTLTLGAAGAIPDSSAVTVSGGTAFDLGGNAETIGSLTGAGQVALGTATLTTGANNTSTSFTGAFTGTGGLTKTGAGTFTLQASGLTGPVSVTGGTLALAADLSAAPFTVATGATLSGTGSLGSLAGTGTVAPGGGGFTVGGLGTSTTFSGAFGGTGALEKVGAGTLTLTASGLLTGGANAQAGTLAFSHADLTLGSALRLGFGGTGSASIANSTLTLPTVERWSVASNLTLDSATLRATGTQPSFINGFTAGSAVIGSGGLTIDTNGYILGLSANTVLSGSGGLTKIGAGTLTLSSAHTYTGPTTVGAGTLALDSTRSGGDFTLTGGTLDLGGFAQTFGTLTLAGGAFANGTVSTGTLSLSAGSLALPVTATGGVNVTGTFTVSTGGNVTATAAPLLVEQSGGTASLTVAAGSLTAARADIGATAGTAGSLSLSSGTFTAAGNVSVGGAGTGTFTVSGGTASAEKILLGYGGGTGSLSLTGGTFTTATIERWSNASGASFSGGTLRATADSSAFLNGFTTGSAVLGSGGLTLDSNGHTLAFSANTVLSGPGGLAKTGSGTLTLGTAQTYTGGTTVSTGTLTLAASDVLPDTGTVTVAAGATLNFANFSETLGPLAGSGALTLGTGALTIASGATTSTFAGILSGTGTLTKTGTGTLTLSGANTFTGGTTIAGGTLALTTGGALNHPSAELVLASSGTGTLSLSGGASLAASKLVLGHDGGTATATFGTGTVITSAIERWSLPSSISFTNTILQAASAAPALLAGFDAGSAAIYGNGLTVDTAGFDATISSSLSGPGTFTKTGAGTLTLSGTNTYTNGTNLFAGTTAIPTGGSLSHPSSTIYVGASGGTATLDLTGGSLTTSGSWVGYGSGSTGTVNLSGGSWTSQTLPIGYLGGTGTFVQTGGIATTGATGLGGGGGTGTLVLNGGVLATTSISRDTPSSTFSAGGGTVRATWDGTTSFFAGFTPGTAILNPGGLTFDTNGLNIASQAPFSGTGGLTKIGSGTLTLTGATTHTGTTTISAGTLALANDAALAGPIDNQAALVVDRTTHLTLAGALTGSGSLLKTGNSTLTLSASGIAAGAVTVSAGTLALTGATVSFASLAGSGNLTLANTALSVGSANTSTTFSGALTGATTLTKTGSGTLTLTTPTLSAGTLTASAGTLALTGSTATFGSLAGSGNVSLTGTALTVGSANTPITFAGNISGTGTLTKTGTGTLTLSGTNTYTGTSFFETGTTVIPAGASLDQPDTTLFLGRLGAAGALEITGGSVTSGIGAVGYFGAFTGTVNLSAGSWTSSSLEIGRLGLGTVSQTGGTLTTGSVRLGDLNGNGSLILAGGVFNTTGIQRLSPFGGISGNGGTLRATADNPAFLSGYTTFLDTGGLTLDTNGFAVTASSTLTGTGSLTKIGLGTLTLSGANTYSGNTAISAGTLRLAAANALPSGTPLTLATGATLDLNNHTASVGKLDGAGNIVLGSANLAVAQSSNSSFTGGISGTGGLVKSGAGLLTLAGAHTYSGATAIDAGQLALTGSAPASAFSVNSGGTLSGTGTLGALTVNSGGTVSPGASPGTLSTGATVFNSGGSLKWEINNATGLAGTNWDLLSISGSLTVASTSGNPFAIRLTSLLANNTAGQVINFNSAQNSSYTLATASGGIFGFSATAFSLDTSGFANPLNGGSWSIAQSGNNLNLTFTASAIPEPSTYAALLGLTALALAAHRRKNRSRSS